VGKYSKKGFSANRRGIKMNGRGVSFATVKELFEEMKFILIYVEMS
jgi:hypothetical protein